MLKNTARILKADGHFQKLHQLKVNDKIINAHGRANRVQKVTHIPVSSFEKQLKQTNLEIRGIPYPLNMPETAYIPVTKESADINDYGWEWRSVRDIQAEEKQDISLAFPWQLVHRNIEFELPAFPDVDEPKKYHLGFLIGIFMICGIIVDEFANKCVYICDNKTLFSIIHSFYELGVTENSGLLEVRLGTYSSQVVPHSYEIYEINRTIFESQRVLPRTWRFSDKNFLRGIYDGIVRGNMLFLDDNIYHQLMFLQLALHDNNLARKNIRRLSLSQDLNAEEYYVLFATDDEVDKTTTAICDGIVPVSCLSDNQQDFIKLLF